MCSGDVTTLHIYSIAICLLDLVDSLAPKKVICTLLSFVILLCQENHFFYSYVKRNIYKVGVIPVDVTASQKIFLYHVTYCQCHNGHRSHYQSKARREQGWFECWRLCECLCFPMQQFLYTTMTLSGRCVA